MPLYEYRCAACGEQFVLLQPVTADPKGNPCPRCGSTATRRIMSAFARAASALGRALGGSCDTGGG